MKSISQMTLKEKIGQLVIVGFDGYEVNDELRDLVKTYKAGNIVLFTRNIKSIEQLYKLNKDLHELVLQETGVMPLISIDQEGGMVTRIMNGATFCPGNMTLATAKPEDAYTDGVIMGEELRALGINMNLAPSLDVNNNPNNPVIGVRSYSDDPNKVGEYGLNYIRGLQSTGVIATSKHFPGHGDTNSDSHKALPIIPHDKERLHSVELVPFKKVLNETMAIMSAHIFFEAYEKEQIPGTLSKNVITGLLREELGYKGLVVSDCMEMKAIDDTFTTPVGVLMGLKAGLDQAMVSHSYEKAVKAFGVINEAVEKGEFTEKEIDEKLERIMKVKNESYELMKKYFYNTTFEEAKESIDNTEHKKFAEKIVDESLTLVKGENFYLNKKSLIIATEPFATTIAEDTLDVKSISKQIKLSGLDVDVYPIKASIEDEEIEKVLAEAVKYEQVLVCTYNATLFKRQADLVNKLYDKVEKLYVLSTRSPYDIYKFKQVKNYLCLYEYSPNSVKTIVKYLKGEIVPYAKLPVNLEEEITVGASIYVGLDDYPVKKNIEYLELLKNKKIDYVFISAHMPEMKESFVEELDVLCKKAEELGIKIILDVSKPMMSKFTVPNIYALRLDYGFTMDEIVEMCKQDKYIIELNASTLTKSKIEYLKNRGVDLNKLRISHNFYPKKYTGLTSEVVKKKNQEFHSLGMKVMVYIPSKVGFRPPMYEGLPTVENHRFLSLPAILSTIKYLEADEVFFGDAYASSEELDYVKKFNFNVPVIPVVLKEGVSEEEKQLLINRVHYNRSDETEYFKRSSVRFNGSIRPFNTVERNKFDVTIDNEKFLRYQGEVCVMCKNIEADERVNVIGKALIDDDVLKAIKPGKPFRFIIVGE